MKGKFKIFPELRLIVACFTGTTVSEDIIQWFDEASNHPEFSKEYQGLVDCRKALFGNELRDKPREMAKKACELVEYMVKIDFTSANWAILVDSPMETSLSMLYSMGASQKHPIEIYSTVEAAEEYLGIPLQDALQELDS